MAKEIKGMLQLSLKDFVKSTLLDINNAVVEAKNEGIPIAYREYSGGGYLPTMKSVEFDIAIQISENVASSKGGEGGLGITVANFKFGRGSNNSVQHETTNRIKFSVDMFLGDEKKNDK